MPLEIDKATDFTTRDTRVLTQTFGNFVFIDEVVGTFDFQGLREIALHDALTQYLVELLVYNWEMQ